jgi:hypothetical protein
MTPFHQLQKNDNKTAHEFKAISLHFTTEIVWGFMYMVQAIVNIEKVTSQDT